MPQLKFSSVEIQTKLNRLDKGVDHLAKLTCINDKTYYIPIRIIEQTAISFYVDDKNDSPTWVSIDKKRTIKASIKALIKAYPLLLTNGPISIYTLNEDDQKQRSVNKLIKRQWKIHEVASWTDGFFVARLSCREQGNDFTNNTQFVLYPALFQSYKPSVSESNKNIYTKHGHWNSSVKINMYRLERAFKSESVWGSLGEVLQNVKYGYDTEKEAKIGFDYVVEKQDTPPIRLTSTGKRNAKRQSRIDNAQPIEIVDYYHCHREEAWLFHSNQHYYIMRMDANSPGIVKLYNNYVSTGFVNVEQSARQLLAELKSKSMSLAQSENNYETCLKDWREMIARDVYQRYFIASLTGSWQIVEVAMLEGLPMAVKAICIPEVSSVLPCHFKPLPYRVLRVENIDGLIKVNEPVRSNTLPWYPKTSVKDFQANLTNFIKEDTDKTRKAVIDMLVYTCGSLVYEKTNEAFINSKHDSIVSIDGEVCPLPVKHNQAKVDYIYQQQRNRIIDRIDNHGLNKEQLNVFEANVSRGKIYSKQLIDFGVSRGILSERYSSKINTHPNQFCDDKLIDLMCDDLLDKKTDSSNINQLKLEVTELVEKPIKSTSISNVGRKRIYKDDKEKKRLWARKHRQQIKDNLLDMGVKPKKPGPIRIYKTAAEKQAAYRFRKKWEKNAVDSSLIVFLEGDNLVSDECVNSIKSLLPYYRKNSVGCGVLIIKTSKNTDLTPLALELDEHEEVLHLISVADYITVINKIKDMNAKSVNFVGYYLSDQAKALATLLKSDDISPIMLTQVK